MGRHRTTRYEECRGRYLRKELGYTQKDMAAYALDLASYYPENVQFRYTLTEPTIVAIENDKPVTWLKALRYTEILNILRKDAGLDPVDMSDMGYTFSTRQQQPHSDGKWYHVASSAMPEDMEE